MLKLKSILGEGQVLLVACDKDRDCLLDDADVAEKVVEDLCGLGELCLVLRIHQDNDRLGATCLDLDLLPKVKVSWNINKAGLDRLVCGATFS